MVKPTVEPLGILFVCLGNICRSPAAEGVFRQRAAEAGLAPRVFADSAGTSDWNLGRPPDRRSLAEAKRRGVSLGRLRARQVRADDFRRFHLILVMDRANLMALNSIRPPGSPADLRLFLDFAPEAGRPDVPDPYHGGAGHFREMFDLIEAGVAGLIAHLRADLG
ncbi:MAG: low molecular weight protein-tyrosine-phosphatase [Rhodospirillales bacterium]